MEIKESALEAKLVGKNWIHWGAPLHGFDDRIVKYSDKPQEHGWGKGVKYFGEWSVKTRQPYGRGIRITSDGEI